MNIQQLALPEQLLCARLCSAHSWVSTNFILSQSWEVGTSIIFILHMKQWSTEKLNKLSKVTQLMTGTWLFFSSSDPNCSAELCLSLHATTYSWIALVCWHICISLQSLGCFLTEIVYFIHIFKNPDAYTALCPGVELMLRTCLLENSQGSWMVSIHAPIWNQTSDSSMKYGFMVFFLSKIGQLLFRMIHSLLSQFQLGVWIRLL